MVLQGASGRFLCDGKSCLKGHIIIPKINRQVILDELKKHIDLTRQESGCLIFQITQDNSDADKFWVYEEFVNKEAFDFHQARVRSSAWGVASADVERHYEPLIMIDD